MKVSSLGVLSAGLQFILQFIFIDFFRTKICYNTKYCSKTIYNLAVTSFKTEFVRKIEIAPYKRTMSSDMRSICIDGGRL